MVVLILVICNIAFGIAVTHPSEAAEVDKSKLVTLREGIDDIGEMTLQTFVDRLAEFDVGGAMMKVTLHVHKQANPTKGFKVRALDQSRASSSPIYFSFLPSRFDDTYVILTTVSYKEKKYTKLRQKIQVLAQLAVLRMDVKGLRRQEEESRRSAKQFRRCLEIQHKWLMQAQNRLRKELQLPDKATSAQIRGAMEEERMRKQELNRRSSEVFDQCVNE